MTLASRHIYMYTIWCLCAAYQLVVKIPQGAVEIRVEEKNISRNYLGTYKETAFQVSISEINF